MPSDDPRAWPAHERVPAVAGAAAGRRVAEDLTAAGRQGLHHIADALAELTDGPASFFFFGLARGALRASPPTPEESVQDNRLSLPARSGSKGPG